MPPIHDSESVSQLIGRLHTRERAFDEDSAIDIERLQSLVFANSLMRYEQQQGSGQALPRQLIVIGPTQSGKSSIMNLLLGMEVAGANPLAGYTRHAQGFAVNSHEDDLISGIAGLLPDWERLPEADQPHATGDQYSLQEVEAATPLLEEIPLLLWDTPDFDSVSSRHYRNNVPEICALADLILLVVSREKYADQSVWRMLRLLAPVGIPLLVCLNKTFEDSQDLLIDALEARLAEESIPCMGVFAIPYREGLGEKLVTVDEVAPLQRRCGKLLSTAAGERPGLDDFILSHWPDWTEPVRQELAAESRWLDQVDAALEQAFALYERDYLQDPHYSDTLQRAVVQLLELLEIPGIAAALVRARKLITWPASKLREMFREQRQRTDDGRVIDRETRVLEEALGHLLIQLQHDMAEQALQPAPRVGAWWQAVGGCFRTERLSIEQAFQQATTAYRLDFESEIKAAAERLMRHLQGHPVTLNGLRAARITTDAAAVALAIKTGGIGLNDLIIAPAMLSFTTLLAEGAVGSYMQQVDKELRQRQHQQVKAELFQGLLRGRLRALPEAMRCERCYGIPEQLLAQADQALAHE